MRNFYGFHVLCITWILTITGAYRENKPCGKDPQWLDVTKEKKVLTSPGWAKGKYPPDQHCLYNLKTPGPNKFILLTFTDFDLESDMYCKKDFVDLTHTGGGGLVPRTYRRCGNFLPTKTLLPSKPYPLNPQILFETNNQTQKRGFRLIYELVDTNQTCKEEEIQCRNMNCVKKNLKCNKKDECGDGTDEENCPINKDKKFVCGQPKVGPLTENWRVRIFGGRKARPGSWPWQVSIQYENFSPSGHVCGGVLINRQWIITAAICTSPLYQFRIKLGNHQQLKLDKGQQIRIAILQIFHPKFDGNTKNNIALMKLNAPIFITDKVQPICLPKKQNAWPPPDGDTCHATGWGGNSMENPEITEDLHEVAVPIMKLKKCKALHKEKIVENTNVCTGFEGGALNPCFGDRGGPLVTKMDGNWTLVGIVSFTSKICGWIEPAVYTRVSSYFKWIKQQIKEHT